MQPSLTVNSTIDIKSLPKQRVFLNGWRTFRKNIPAMVGLIFVISVFLFAIIVPFFRPMERAIAISAQHRLLPPSLEFPMGTDSLGRDMFARIANGARVSLTMGLLPVFVSFFFGMWFGAAAAYYGGVIDDIIMRVCDIFACIPGILMALLLVMILGPGITNMMIALSITSIPGRTRFVRSIVLQIVGQDYIEAARACGTRPTGLIFRHILPNAFSPLLLSIMGSIAGMVMIGAGLSFLGLGLQPPYPEWGSLMFEARPFMREHIHLFYFPGLLIIITMLGFNMLGDGLRDVMDPRLKQ